MLEKVFYTSVLISDQFPWDYVAQFQDLDGNRLQLREGREEQA